MSPGDAVVSPPKPVPAKASLDAIGAVMDAMNDALVLLDENGVVARCNRAAIELLDLTTGNSWVDELASQVKRKRLKSEGNISSWLQQAAEGREVTFYVEYYPEPDRVMQLQLVVTPINLDGRQGSLATARDVTPLIEKTREANDMMRLAQKHSRELTDLTDLSNVPGFTLTHIYQRYLGKLVALLESKRSAIYLYNPAKQRLERAATTSASSFAKNYRLNDRHIAARSFRSRQPVLVKQGPGVAANALAVPVSFGSKLQGVLVVSHRSNIYRNHDVRLLQLVATRLAVLIENAGLYHEVNARRERWEAVFTFTGEGIVVFDPNGKIAAFNPAATKLIGWTDNEVIGKSFNDIIKVVETDENPTKQTTPVQQVLEDAAIIAKRQQLIKTKAGETVWTEITYSPIIADDGSVASGIAVITDIQKDRELEMVQRDFISIASHEMRTPLSAIKGFLSMLLQKDVGEITPKQEHFLKRVYQSNQRMINLVEDLLDASYIDSGKIRLNIAPLAVEPIVADVVAELTAKGLERQILIKVKRRQRLPMVLADDVRLRQILTNLIDNAIKYSMPKSEVSVDFKLANDKLTVSVIDQGVGLSATQIDRLFQKFGRVYNPMSVQAGGTGLGLYIVKNLVESLGGRIWVTSRENKGSKFSFTLPVAHQLPLLDSGV